MSESVMLLRMRSVLTALVAAIVVLVGSVASASAQSGIRDAEIERLLRSYGDPIFVAAGLDPKSIEMIIINDNSLNAFVAGGQNVFLNTGMIMFLDSPNQLIGVIAHETGHISGGHLIRGRKAIEGATVPMIISMIAGVAAIAAGAPDAGMGIMLGGRHVAERSVLAFSRAQESSADQAGLSFLEATGQSGRGMMETFDAFSDQELLTVRRQDPFARTHPMNGERIASLRDRASASRYFDKPVTAKEQLDYDMMRAKLRGFIEKPEIALRRYPLKDHSKPARYARAIAYYRTPDFENALSEIRSLIAEEPNNAFFHELEGQIITESGDPRGGIGPYQRSVELAPDEPLLRTGLAGAMLSTEDDSLAKAARDHLVRAVRDDPTNALAWHYLAQAYERLGEHSMANLSIAERAFAIHDYGSAMMFATRAATGLKAGSSERQRASDILQIAQTQHEEEKEK
jgi:predicted Zn-dependent protease